MAEHPFPVRRKLITTSAAWLLPVASASAIDAAAELLHWGIDEADTVVVGEVHGTREIPRLVGDLAELMLDDRALLVVLELPTDERSSIALFLDSDGGPAARRALLQGAFWQREHQDGRSSEAMLALLERLRRLQRTDRQLSVMVLEGELAAAAAQRDRLREEGTNPRLLVLAANYRAGAPGEASPKAGAAARCGQTNPDCPGKTWRIDVTAWTGDYWTCDGEGLDACRAWPLQGSGSSREPMLHSDEATRARGFDAQLILPAISASPPARERLER